MRFGGNWAEGSVDEENRYRFNGIEHEESVGLDLAPFRAYDPAIGRWTMPDPIYKFHESGFAAFANNPVLYPDPMGLDTVAPNILPAAEVKAKDGSATRSPVEHKAEGGKSKGGGREANPPSGGEQKQRGPLFFRILGMLPRATSLFGALTYPATLGPKASYDEKHSPRPQTPDVPEDEGIVLYQGVHVTHPDYPNAQLGIATPWGGHSDPEKYGGGNMRSLFTSWTVARSVADYHANKSGPGGVVLKKEIL